MNRSETIIKIAPALLAAQKSIGAAKKGAENPFFHSSYADLGEVMKACKDALNENGISVLQPVGTDENGIYIETVLLHESGEFISERMRLAVKSSNNPQDQGSAISYGRRYSLQSLVFIPAEDDDANKASKPEKPEVRHENGLTYEKTEEAAKPVVEDDDDRILCEVCGQEAKERKGTTKNGKPYHGIFCTTGDKSHTRWLWS